MTDRRLVDVVQEAKRAQALVWNAIRQGAMLIEAANPQGIIDALDREAAAGPGAGWSDPDPKVHADLQRKRQLLEAAAQFQREWSRIRFEALTQPTEGADDGEGTPGTD